jgi:hypothetical protein
MATKGRNLGLEHMERTLAPMASPVRVLFTSKSSAGAWQIRGEQIAGTRTNWHAKNRPDADDIAACDLLCVVKKPDSAVIEAARSMGKPIVYDIVDAWAQPEDGLKYTNLAAARELFGPAWRALRADAYVFPTRRMQLDLGGLVRHAITIYHHYWPQLEANPMRDPVQVVGYEGADYLGGWRQVIDKACASRGLRFVANPPRYTDMDVVVIARGGEHGNFLASNYKSNVKLANAIGSGTPALVHVDEMSAHDTDTGDVLFFTDEPGSFERQLDRLAGDAALRARIHRSFLDAAPRFHISNIAGQFEGLFLDVMRRHQRHAQHA